jgi:hypothetical protein
LDHNPPTYVSWVAGITDLHHVLLIGWDDDVSLTILPWPSFSQDFKQASPCPAHKTCFLKGSVGIYLCNRVICVSHTSFSLEIWALKYLNHFTMLCILTCHFRVTVLQWESIYYSQRLIILKCLTFI